MKNKKGITATIAVLAVVITFTIGYIVYAADAGSSDDPLISLSFLNNVFKPDLLKTVDKKIEDANPGDSGSEKNVFVAVEVKTGNTILYGEGTEFILRSGKAVSVCPGQNGLVDATAGLDLADGLDVTANHLFIVPRKDGRGIAMTVDGFVMIKGAYTIQ
jgi:hypothetical protein